LKAAVKPPEIITLTSAAPAAPANSSALATPSTAARKFADFNLTIDRSSLDRSSLGASVTRKPMRDQINDGEVNEAASAHELMCTKSRSSG
jgi:hypothetical protein